MTARLASLTASQLPCMTLDISAAITPPFLLFVTSKVTTFSPLASAVAMSDGGWRCNLCHAIRFGKGQAAAEKHQRSRACEKDREALGLSAISGSLDPRSKHWNRLSSTPPPVGHKVPGFQAAQSQYSYEIFMSIKAFSKHVSTQIRQYEVCEAYIDLPTSQRSGGTRPLMLFEKSGLLVSARVDGEE